VLSSGWSHDLLRRRGRADAPFLVGAIGAAGLFVPAALLPASGTLASTIVLFAVALYFASFPLPPSTAALQLLAPNRMRSRLSAMFLFCNSLVGLALGSALVGVLNDRVFGAAGVAKSMSIVVAGAALATAMVLAAGMPRFRHSLEIIVQPEKVV
jgi:hypothetical protein